MDLTMWLGANKHAADCQDNMLPFPFLKNLCQPGKPLVCSSMDAAREVYLFKLQKICLSQIFVECKPVQADRRDSLIVRGIYTIVIELGQ